MINQYGADAVRWFILSDSPPEKDIQWSDAGVASANKFLQKIWDLNNSAKKRPVVKSLSKMEDAFTLNVNNFTFKIDQSIKQFKFNVSIALFYETYNYFRVHLNEKVSNKVFIDNLIKFVKLMIPFTPHLAFECWNYIIVKKLMIGLAFKKVL